MVNIVNNDGGQQVQAVNIVNDDDGIQTDQNDTMKEGSKMTTNTIKKIHCYITRHTQKRHLIPLKLI